MRSPNGRCSSETTASLRWARKVTTLEATVRTKNGAFSRINFGSVVRAPCCVSRVFDPSEISSSCALWSGQISSSNITNGIVTNIALAIRLSAKSKSAQPYQALEFEPTFPLDFDGAFPMFDACAYFAYASKVSRPKKVLSTSFRSESHATDSTCTGCSANKAATNAAGQSLRVILQSSKKSRTALAAWKRTLTKCCGPGSPPNRLASIMCEIQVSGCQLLPCQVVKAHLIPAAVRPAFT